jgi:putative transposase
MVRTARIKSESGYYHILLRGNNRDRIFHDNKDRKKFLTVLSEQVDKGFISVIAYCLMDNHIHFLIRENINQLVDAMRSLNTTYALYFNKKYNRSGHLFQNRYQSESIEDEKYLFAALRYIHQNPINANICSHVENYRWSSDLVYRNPELNSFVDTNILSFINRDRATAIGEYIRLMKSPEKETFLEIPENILSDAEMKTLVKAELNSAGIKNLNDISNKNALITTIRVLHRKHGLSIRKIAEIIKISKSSVQYMIKNN